MTWRTDGLKQNIWDAENNASHDQRIKSHDNVDIRHKRAIDGFCIGLTTQPLRVFAETAQTPC
jgi:hypothetical protein